MAVKANVLLAAIPLAYLLGVCTPDTVTTPPKFVINLDLSPAYRWQKVVATYSYLLPDIHAFLKQYIPEDAIPLVEAIAQDIEQYLPQPYAEEIIGISKLGNISMGDITLINLVYDFTAFCTSIVSQDTSGRIWHSRNLDYGNTELLRNATISVDFQSQGKTVYSAVTFVGYVGLLTGQRPNAFTVTTDERDQGDWWMNFLLALLDRNAYPLSFLIRDTLEKAQTFDIAVSTLSFTDTVASAYLILGGVEPNEGKVITKGRLDPVDVWQLAAPDRWFLVETNYDHWTTPPPEDNRRDPAIHAMNTTGPANLSVASLFKVMSTVPVLNNSTAYTVVMSAGQPDLMMAWVRHYPN